VPEDLTLRSRSREKYPLSQWYRVGPNSSIAEVNEPYHISDEVINVVKSTAARLDASTDSIFDIERRENKPDEGREDICQMPARSPKNPDVM
jgi:hypothetical protein